MPHKYSDTFVHTIPDLIPYPNLTYNYVLAGMMQDVPIVLKLRCDNRELEKEVAALHAFKDYGCVTILSHDNALGAILLERVVPGDSLVSYFPHKDSSATFIASSLVRDLHRVPIPSCIGQ